MDTKSTALVGNIQKFSTEDGPGVRTTVFLKGCPLNCEWCHNPEMIRSDQQMIINPNNCIGCGECIKTCPKECISFGEEGPQIDWDRCDVCMKCSEICYAEGITPVAKEMSVSDILETVLQDKPFYDETGGGVTLSGGEVLMQNDFAGKVIDACAAEDINVCIDTSGYCVFDKFYELARKPNVTTILYDVKHIDNQKHLQYTGVENKLILENLQKLAEDPEIREKIILRMPLIKGINDDEETIGKTKDFYEKLGLKKVSLIAFHQLGEGKRRRIGKTPTGLQPPEDQRIYEIQEVFESIGMQVELVGVGKPKEYKQEYGAAPRCCR